MGSSAPSSLQHRLTYSLVAMSPSSADMYEPKASPIDDVMQQAEQPSSSPATRLHPLFFASDFFRWLHIQCEQQQKNSLRKKERKQELNQAGNVSSSLRC